MGGVSWWREVGGWGWRGVEGGGGGWRGMGEWGGGGGGWRRMGGLKGEGVQGDGGESGDGGVYTGSQCRILTIVSLLGTVLVIPIAGTKSVYDISIYLYQVDVSIPYDVGEFLNVHVTQVRELVQVLKHTLRLDNAYF